MWTVAYSVPSLRATMIIPAGGTPRCPRPCGGLCGASRGVAGKVAMLEGG